VGLPKYKTGVLKHSTMNFGVSNRLMLNKHTNVFYQNSLSNVFKEAKHFLIPQNLHLVCEVSIEIG
jgi:hypothetical protein